MKLEKNSSNLVEPIKINKNFTKKEREYIPFSDIEFYNELKIFNQLLRLDCQLNKNSNQECGGVYENEDYKKITKKFKVSINEKMTYDDKLFSTDYELQYIKPLVSKRIYCL